MYRTLYSWILPLTLALDLTVLQASSAVRASMGQNASFNFTIIRVPGRENFLFIRNNYKGDMIQFLGNDIIYIGAYRNRAEFTGNIHEKRISFLLKSVTVADAGRYTAVIEGSEEIWGDQTLIVIAPPSNPQIIEVSTAVSGFDYILRCSAQSNSATANYSLIMMSEWRFKNGQLIISGGRYSVRETNLTITGLSYEEDNGETMTCVVYEDLAARSNVSNEFTIDVKYGPHKVHIIGDPLVNEGGRLTLICSGTCNPICDRFQWRKGSQSTPIALSPSLEINNVRRDSAGFYTCTVINSAISNSSTTQINVTVYYGPDTPLSLDPNITFYRNIEDASFPNVTCLASCNPPCYYAWIGPQSNTLSRVLSLGTLQRSERGSYICTATNPVTYAHVNGNTVQVDVIYGPDNPNLSPNATVYTRLEGEIVPNITCSADCFPSCMQIWIKGVSTALESNREALTLGHVYRDNAGNYTCHSTNTETNTTGHVSINLVVQFPPVLTMKATNDSKGKRVVMNCTASGVPDNYTFYKWTHMAPDENRTIVRELEVTRVTGSDVSFIIEGATYQDSGFYKCKASNGIPHHSTGRLIMEDILSIWITDKPIISSKDRYFDAEKGKPAHMHIEFYAGHINPTVTWYRHVKNVTMEQLHNSSDFKIYLSPVAVRLKYQNATVQLQGYNAGLDVSVVSEEYFTFYTVEIKNNLTKAVIETIELKPRGPPETPTRFTVVARSVTTHSLQLTWRAGFDGGAPQTFVIEYKMAGNTIWLNKSEPTEFTQYDTLNTTISGLKEGTSYEFRIYSENIFNQSQKSSIINETTKTVEKGVPLNQGGSTVIIGAATGSALVLLLAVVIIGILFYKRRQATKSPVQDTLQDEKSVSDRCGSDLVDNPVYNSSGQLPLPSTIGGAIGVDYAAVIRPRGKRSHVEDSSKLYASVEKTKKERKGGDTYENITLGERGAGKNKTNVNPGDLDTDANVYENRSAKAAKMPLAKRDSMLYADLMLSPPATKNGKFVIRGLENRTEYAKIAYGIRGEQLPDNEEEEDSYGAKA